MADNRATKKVRVGYLLTPKAKAMIKEVADFLDVTNSEALERIVRSVYDNGVWERMKRENLGDTDDCWE